MCFVAAASFAGDPLLQITKCSNSREFEPSSEVKAFYLKLVADNAEVKRQFEKIAKRSPNYSPEEPHCGPAEPQVVEWFPRTDQWRAPEYFNYDERYLVIQPLEFGSHGWSEYLGAVVSEFRVLHKGKTKPDPKNPEGKTKIVSDVITIQFLGFQDFVINNSSATK